MIWKNVSAYRSSGIFNKMILIISFLLLLSFLFSLTVLQYVYRIYDKQIYEKASEVLGMSSISIENALRELDQLSFTVVSDEQIQECLRQLQNDPQPYERQVLHNKIINRLVAFAGAEKYVYSMMLMDTSGGVMTAGNREGVSQDLQDQLKPLAAEASGSIVWYPQGNRNSLLAVRQIKSYTGSTFTLDDLGTLVIRIRIDLIIADSTSDTDQLIAVDATTGQAIYPEVPILLPEELKEETERPELYRTAKYQEGTYFITKTKSSYIDWIYINATPFNEMFKHITFVKKLVVIIFALILLIGLLLGYRLARSIVRPISKLTKKMKQIEKGDLDNLEEQSLGVVSQTAQDEVSQLNRTFKMMIRRIRELIDENYAKQLIIRETELKALQAQINPHFLYNTLESINWLAKMNKQAKISEMVEALGYLFRSSIGLKDPLITLEKEITIVRNYVIIQKTRFDERLDFRMDVPENLHDALIPKLTLQPLIENAIRYALEPNIEPCTISITVSEEDQGLDIKVSDNGPGMSAEFIKDLQMGRVKTRGEGIGLANIAERIQIVFGPEWGTVIESEPGQGTTIHVRIPYLKGVLENV
ncbi:MULTISPECIES: sensor histidine kinase [Paenibacillus]|uniref:sensor histidine kinase n=1 Tax=Paenibacillus TaxID=44249 RepID=UPI0003E29BBA|nr:MULTISPECIES: sensor histidine kinase [Paenibacillus]ETT49452.1 two-component sensor histidine kinase [Paenibacillus sp. FSL H8-237]OMC99025.1 two-component sensor histidine kinase [Paenibacillus odorifer]OME36784.1 two-component sensor histidine kinase [Paenibacillus odorifer]OME60242.1 two-component sensor histidine kinase [Paenibacillus odorifer]OME63180.1 two-component sensor histidine kinase [Paenibacillus odorifer]